MLRLSGSKYCALFFHLDFDECNTSPCNQETERCVNSPGSYKCLCKPDYARTKKGNCIEKEGTNKNAKKKKAKSKFRKIRDAIVKFLSNETVYLTVLFVFNILFLAVSYYFFRHRKFYHLSGSILIYSVVVVALNKIFSAGYVPTIVKKAGPKF